MKPLILIAFFVLNLTSAFAQATRPMGLLIPETEVKYLRLISIATSEGSRLASTDTAGLNIQPLDLPSFDLRNFNTKFANELSGHDMIFCSVNAFKGKRLFIDPNDIAVESVRVCVDENQQIVASRIDTFEAENVLKDQDFAKLRELSMVPMEPLLMGMQAPLKSDDSGRGEKELSSESNDELFLELFGTGSKK